jgi:hypothetical protein
MAEFITHNGIIRCREVTRTLQNGVILETWGEFRPLAYCGGRQAPTNRALNLINNDLEHIETTALNLPPVIEYEPGMSAENKFLAIIGISFIAVVGLLMFLKK